MCVYKSKYTSLAEAAGDTSGNHGTFEKRFPGQDSNGISIDTLGSLIDPKNVEKLQELGGVEGLATALSSNVKEGLPPEDDIPARQIRYGRNVLPPRPVKSLWQILTVILADMVLRILIVAAVISIILGVLPWTSEDPKYGWVDGVAILVAVIIILVVTSANDLQKQKQFQKLEAKKNDREVEVVRAGHHEQISVFDVCVGDILALRSGDILSVDGVFARGHALKCDESTVTGESDAVRKGRPEDRADPFFISGSVVMEGNGEMLVTAVGVNSFQGKTLLSLQTPDEVTPLQEKLEVMATRIGYTGLAAAVLMLLVVIPKYFITKAINNEKFTPQTSTDIVRYLVEAISIVVVAIPEGLPLAVTITLAYGVLKLLRENNLVRYLSACETMSHCTNICSDKTGTLTQNSMTVVTGWLADVVFSESENAKSVLTKISEEVAHIITQGLAVNSTSNEIEKANGLKDFTGSKTEGALLRLVSELGGNYLTLRNKSETVHVYPFSPVQKRMSTVVKHGPYNRIFTKGASEIVLGLCTTQLHADGTVTPMSPADRKQMENIIQDMASDALRTICFAYADVDPSVDLTTPPEDNLTLVGIVGIRDPIRPEVVGAVKACQGMGITVRMVTGDNIVTAEHIARRCEILTRGGLCIDGPTFRKMTEAEVYKILPNLQVLARSSPQDKKLLVEYLKNIDEVVAVTGDGTNDAPALKTAHIGFSMGVSGTEVAIAASSIVLLDDNFASIIKAILWGRNIFDAIRKFIQFQLTVNIVAVTIAFVGSVSGTRSPLTALQLLWVNLIMDTLAALALATESPSEEVLNRGPVRKSDSLISYHMWRNIFCQAIYQLAASFTLLFAGHHIFGVVKDSVVHYTIIFNAFVWMQLFNEINSRKLMNEKNMFSGIQKNPMFLAVMVATVVVQVLFVEVGGRFTSTAPLTLNQWLMCLAIGAMSLPLGLLMRFIPVPRPGALDWLPCIRRRDAHELLTSKNGEPRTQLQPARTCTKIGMDSVVEVEKLCFSARLAVFYDLQWRRQEHWHNFGLDL
eukprot:Phypoly_transcript_01643.p1 GENE.Phypoly_transcript_01643~~Phypoly_transcript_01643.p1  ORF type:complete len:1033 (+),score=152.15 Phypoly_transcript_01643:95-3193(+)